MATVPQNNVGFKYSALVTLCWSSLSHNKQKVGMLNKEVFKSLEKAFCIIMILSGQNLRIMLYRKADLMSKANL